LSRLSDDLAGLYNQSSFLLRLWRSVAGLLQQCPSDYFVPGLVERFLCDSFYLPRLSGDQAGLSGDFLEIRLFPSALGLCGIVYKNLLSTTNASSRGELTANASSCVELVLWIYDLHLILIQY
jgi:hypothetical protein